jgi:hypothetical protein
MAWAEQRMILQQASLFLDFRGNDLRKARMPFVKESGKAIETASAIADHSSFIGPAKA